MDPVPWTVPEIGVVERAGKRHRFTTRRKKSNVTSGQYSLEDWQKVVKTAASQAAKAAGLTEPITGPVRLDYEFFAVPIDRADIGSLWGTAVKWDDKVGKWKKITRGGKTDPDVTNIIKSTEDALQGDLLADDSLVRSGGFDCVYAAVPGVRVTVSLFDKGDHGPGTAANHTVEVIACHSSRIGSGRRRE